MRFTGPELVTRAFDAFRSTGLPLEELNLTMDLEPRPGKSEHAYCFPVRPPHDIRVLANLTPGLDSYETMFHELGHAVQAAGVAQRSVILRDPPSGAFSEAIGQLFGGLVSTPSWLTGALGMSAGDADEVRAWVRERRLVAARWSLVWIAVERQLFCAPSQDPTAVFWDECARVLGVDASPELRGIAAWARVPHYVGHPVYLQNYLVADVIAAQLEETLEARFGGLHEQREAGAALRTTIFEPGAVLRGDALLRSVTGRDLDLGPYLRRWLGVAWPADGIAT